MKTGIAFKALADPTRREILRLLDGGEKTAGQLAAHFPIAAASMSHHFSLLKQADLVTTRRDGQQIVYSLNTTVFQDVVRLLLDIAPRAARSADEEAKP
ncbi:MAG: autorepressor SdpR family transcription factor [Capsulimonadales bacterium]|nr:autorepressor SdpR family transcription factor [Capsulimonadales bacterium]